jgi:GSH-dependent disulfide-bond oxidoreductase
LPDRANREGTPMIDLYTFTTPNGRKVSIMLEETALPYTTHVVHIGKGEQLTPEYLKVNPNNKIPAIIDNEGPGGGPYAVFESGAILIYLAEKSGQLLSKEPRARYDAIQWLMLQMSGVGPMFGQAMHFTRAAPEKLPYAIERFTKESARLLKVLDDRLTVVEYLAGDYSIADVATYPWIAPVLESGFAKTLGDFPNITRWAQAVGERPAVQRGMKIPEPPK